MTSSNRKAFRDITEGSTLKNILYLALPMMVGTFLQDLFNIVDMIFIGRLGPAAISGIAIGGVLQGLLFTVASGVSIGAVAVISRAYGGRRYEDAERASIQTVFIGFTLWFLALLFSKFFLTDAVSFLARETAGTGYALEYTKIIFNWSFVIFLSFGLNFSLRGAGDTLTPVIIMGIASLVNIILDPIFIYGLFGFPRMEVAGSALATVIARGIGVTLLLWRLFSGKLRLHFRQEDFRFDPKMTYRILKLGFFSMIQNLSRNISGIILMRLASNFGTIVIAAYGIVLRVILIAMMPGFGFGTAASTTVGQNLGAGKPKRSIASAWLAVLLYEAVTAIFMLAFIFAGKGVLTIFTNSPEVIQAGKRFLTIIGLQLPFMALAMTLSRALNGAGDTKNPMIATIVCTIGIRIALATYLSGQIGELGLIWGIAISQVVEALVITFVFLRGHWQRIRV